MKTLTLNFTDFFKHNPEKCVSIGGVSTATAFYDVPEDAFSQNRPAGARKVIKANGFGRVLDYLYEEKSACIYYNKSNGMAYVEFVLDETHYHSITYLDSMYFEEENVPGRWHFLPAYLGRFDYYGETFLNLRAYEAGPRNRNKALAFCDSFYYEAKQDGFINSPINVTFGANALKMAKNEFKAGDDIVKYGDLVPEFDPFKEFKSSSKKKSSRKTSKKETLWEDIKDGKHILDYSWSPEQQACITPLSFLDTYVPDKHFYNVFNQAEKRLKMALERIQENPDAIASKKDAVNMFVVGKPGTGKTYMLHALSAALGLPIRSIPMGKNTEEDTFEGMTKIIEGNLTEVQTPFLINGQQGGISVIEEINLASPDVVMGAIGQFVEFPYSIMEQGYKQVKRHPLNIIFGTMNIGTAGAKEVNEALSSRFSQTIVLDDPEEDDFIARLVIEGFDEDISTWVYDRYTDIIETLKSPDYNCEEYCLNVNFRSCLGALQAIECGCEPKEAIRNTMVGKIAEKDMEIAERIWDMIQYKPDFNAK